MRRQLLAALLGGTLALLLSGCAQPSQQPAPTGSLQVDVSGLPAGVDAAVVVRGPNGFSRALDAGETLDELAPGSYIVSGNSAVASAAVAIYVATVSGSPATVEADATATVEVAYGAEPGSLEVAIAGLPAGSSTTVAITGPNGFSQDVDSDTTLTGLTPGSYTITADSTLGTEAIVPFLYDPALPSFEVEVSSDTVARAVVAFSARPGSGRMWISQFNVADPVNGYAAVQLGGSGSPAPVAEFGGASFPGEGLAFEADGDLWVADFDDRLLRYDAADLIAGGAVTPAVTITSDGAASPSLPSPIGIAFDDAGTLWVANTADRIEGFTAAQLATGGSPTPAVVIEPGPGAGLGTPVGIAFDAAGSLWVANRGATDTVIGYSPAQLASGGAIDPAVVLPLGDSPTGVAFDASGNLWVTKQATGTVVRFAPGQLAASGTPTPTATISAASFAASPLIPVIDHDGGLWVVLTDDSVVRIANAATLSGTTTLTPDPVIAVGNLDGGFPTFWPPPPELPIRAP